MLDSHCHVDLLTNPIERAREFNATLSVCVAVTYLPEHYELACQHLVPFPRVVSSLGMHPLHAVRAHAQLSRFRTLAKTARYIGEVGLDDSSEGKTTFALQTEVFGEVVSAVQPGSFLTVHSRNAWQETVRILSEHGVGPVCFHYFTGGAAGADAVLERGHYLSVNRRMVVPTSVHAKLISRLPRSRILVESDAPFLGEQAILKDLETVYRRLADFWHVGVEEAYQQVEYNFSRCRTLT